MEKRTFNTGFQEIIKTPRLILRPWRESDAAALYEYARDKRVGPAAGWPAHTSVEDSLRVIKDVLSVPGTWAVTLRGVEEAPVGSIGVMPARHERIDPAEPEIGYWIGVPLWGRGLIPEAVKKLLEIEFTQRGAERVWCGHYEGNTKSKSVIEKCGFVFSFADEVEVPALGERRCEYMYVLTRERWKDGR